MSCRHVTARQGTGPSRTPRRVGSLFTSEASFMTPVFAARPWGGTPALPHAVTYRLAQHLARLLHTAISVTRWTVSALYKVLYLYVVFFTPASRFMLRVKGFVLS
ncbi:hypothetical protein E2C01_075620 [Portunus trituberculatus]|uniref:Uncharacterized protein n=1 Tax=Portunus trituberculatus TaxID=210409 RepID=A0A5B7I921_PORTR|nr:hypothetical protein [Portunus trituberculatus]